VTAPPDVLESRLKARGRDGDIAGRLARSAKISSPVDADLLIQNVGARETNAEVLVQFLEKTLN
jgi:ribose 1,5-bisphosphokinase PhnN